MSYRASIAVIVSASLSACASAGRGPKSSEGLATAFVAAAKAGDDAAFDRLWWPVDDAGMCDADAREDLVTHRIRAHEDFAECHRSIDWAHAGKVSVTGGAPSRALKGCGGAAIRLADIEISVDVQGEAGLEQRRIHLDDPISVDGRYYLGDDIKCRQPVAPTPHETKAPDGQGSTDGMAPACADFIERYARCIEQMPENVRESAGGGLEQMRQAWTQAGNTETMEAACKQALDAMKSSVSAICPDVFGN